MAETSSTNVVTNHVVTYDASGNNRGETAGAATRVLTWDEEDRLKQVDVSGTTKGRFLYSASGERTQKQEANGLTTFYVNQYLVLHGNKNVTKHIYAGDTRLASKTESATMTTPVKHFYHPDQVGSTSYITDGSQNLMQHERYFPFGESWVDKAKAEAATSLPRNWLFNAKELDGDTGYYYYGARYFEPRSAAWVSPDPILASYMGGKPNNGAFSPKNLSLYGYAWNNPIVVSDPSGKCPQCPGDALASKAGESALAQKQLGSFNKGTVASATFLGGVGLIAKVLGFLGLGGTAAAGGAAAAAGSDSRVQGAGQTVLAQGERIKLIFERLRDAPAARSPKEALNLLTKTVDAVEDAHSGVAKVAEPGLGYAGRMYAPMADRVTQMADGTLEAITKGQRILFGSNGSIDIFRRGSEELLLKKPGGSQ